MGDYYVQITLPGGYKFAPQNQGNDDSKDSDTDVTTGKTDATHIDVNENDPTWDSGLYQPASIGDFVWNDLNVNGIQDSGEIGISGVTVKLFNSAGTEIATTVTDNNGKYAFTNLVPGDYYVEFTAPTGYKVSPQDQGNNDSNDSDINPATGRTPVTTLISGENDVIWDAGLYYASSISDLVWNDVNGNGIQDSNETGIEGVGVKLFNSSGTELANTVTDISGKYIFANLAPGDYYLEFTPPSGYKFTQQNQGTDDIKDSDADTATGKTPVTTITPGENDSSWDVGLYKPLNIIGDLVWNDTNTNGIQDNGETGIPGVKVTLFNGTGVEVAGTVTDSSGKYDFTNIAPGDYYLEFTAPDGYEFSPQNKGDDDTADSDADTTTGRTPVTSVTASENDLTWDAGLYNTASIGDLVWNDINADGIQNNGEKGVSGIIVRLFNASDTELANTTTDTDGKYLFSNLAPGEYYLEFTLPSGYKFSPRDNGNDDTADSDVNTATGKTALTTIIAGENDLAWDAGIYQPVNSIGDLVWHDLDANGIQDSGENGIADVTVKLFTGSGTEVAVTTTDSDGIYSFANIAAGDYYLEFTAPDGYDFSPQNTGNDDTQDSDADTVAGRTSQISLSAAENDLSWDAGLYQSAELGNYIWYDANENGIQDAGEKGVAGVKVNLINPATGNLLDSAVTDGSGYYKFTNLVPGDYGIEFIPPEGYIFSPQNEGSGALQDVFDSDADTVTGRTSQITLSSGGSNLTLDTGIFIPDTKPASLGDYVWYDTDKNGIQDNDEKGVSGVTVYLINPLTDEILATAITNGSGLYLFEGLIPGNYAVEFELPADYIFTASNKGSDDAADSDADIGTGRTGQVALTAGENNLTLDAGIFIQGREPASIGNYVWYDADTDGIQDSGESGLSGINVNLINPVTGKVLATAKTDTVGYYEFAGLAPGDYIVQFEPPAGYTFTSVNQGSDDSLDSDANQSTGKTEIISLKSGDKNTNTDAGLYAPDTITIGDLVWLDKNNDGSPNTGEGIAGVTLMLFDGNGSLLETAITDKNGNYSFQYLPHGDYRITVDTGTLPEGVYEFSDPDGVTDSATDLINQSDDNLNADFGYRTGSIASLGNFVWYDTNENGIQDASEKGVAGITVNLINPATGKIFDTASTDGAGFYEFKELTPGKYIVEFVIPAGYVFSPQNEGSGALQDAFDSDTDTVTGRTAQVTLSAGDRNLTLDAGIFVPDTEPASLGDYVWYDTNENGIQDKDENGISGVTVRLINPVNEEILASTVTDGSGLYRFEGLIPGDYAVEFELPPDYRFTAQNQGSDEASESDADTVTGRTAQVTLIAGENNLNIDAGMFISGTKPAGIGNYVWYDNDRDGLQDEDEHGFAGVTVELYDSTGTVLIASVKTDADGYYAFSGLIPGDYIVKFDVPSGYRLTDRNQGNDDSLDSDANPSTGKTGIITVAAGEIVTHADAGLSAFNPITIGDLIWLDMNYDGKPNAGEGIPGITVMLYDGNGVLFDTTVTDENGNYNFTELPPGDYRVTVDTDTLPEGSEIFSDPDDTEDSSADLINLSADKMDADFGYHLLKASLGNFVWYDLNQNGIQDASEKGVSGIKVNLINPATGKVIDTTTTDGSGFYEFTELNAGDYAVEFVPPAGYLFTPRNKGTGELQDAFDSDADTETGRTAQVTLSAGDRNLTLDAGIFVPDTEPASLGDYVWYDTNENGIQDNGENGISNVTVRLINPMTEEILAVTATDGSGLYSFEGLMPGDYAVEFELPDDYRFTVKNQGADTRYDSNADELTGRTEQVTLSGGENNLNIDAGMFIPGTKPAGIGDYVWYDNDRDGLQDEDENGFAGVTVELYDSTGSVLIASVKTDADGYYAFSGLIPGDYIVKFDVPSGYRLRDRNQGNDDSLDSDANPSTGKTGIITVAAGDVITYTDAGLFAFNPITIGDLVWLDINGNGSPNSNEGISGVKVILSDENGIMIATTITDNNGNYSFTGLPPGDYRITVDSGTLPEGITAYSDPDGTPDSMTDLMNQSVDNLNADFGYRKLLDASIGDFVWYDANENGIRDSGEKGVSDVSVYLINPLNNEVLATTTTNAIGFYGLAGLTPGDYIVEFILPENYQFTIQNHETNDFMDSNANPVTGRTEIITLSSGENNLTIDAGILSSKTELASLGDYVWYDANQNGIQDADENGVAGVKVNLTNPLTGEVIASAFTDSKGFYQFTGLVPCDYAVQFVLPEGYEFTSQNQGNDDSADSDADTETGHTSQRH